jgi:hypothetical protein
MKTQLPSLDAAIATIAQEETRLKCNENGEFTQRPAYLVSDTHRRPHIGVKTERIRTDSSETVFVTIFFSDSESERIVCRYEYGIGVYR